MNAACHRFNETVRRGRTVALIAAALALGALPARAHHLEAGSAYGAGGGTARTTPAAAGAAAPGGTVEVRLSEWKITLSPAEVRPGRVTFHVTNAGQVPHAFEIEGHGLERETAEIEPGKSATLAVDLRAPATGGARGRKAGRARGGAAYATYDVYCPVGKGSHRMLGMRAKLAVEAEGADEDEAKGETAMHGDDGDAHDDMAAMSGGAGAMGAEDGGSSPRAMRVTGGGAVIQILPGPFPFADSAQAVIRTRPAGEQADLVKKEHVGPYSNVVAPIRGDISLFALDRGAAGDSVAGSAHFTTRDGAQWTLDLNHVQTRDIPFNPRFGGVIMGLFYHGASNVHTPLVPTIQSSLALWAYGRLQRNGQPVADSAMVHIMLLSRTRREGDWALDCWDCSSHPVEELQLQVTPRPGAPPFDAPGGFLFVNWEKSTGQDVPVEGGAARPSVTSPARKREAARASGGASRG